MAARCPFSLRSVEKHKLHLYHLVDRSWTTFPLSKPLIRLASTHTHRLYRLHFHSHFGSLFSMAALGRLTAVSFNKMATCLLEALKHRPHLGEDCVCRNAHGANTLRLRQNGRHFHYNDVIMSAMASQITSLTIVDSTVYSRRRSKKTSKLRVTGLCAGNSPMTVKFPSQRASNAENVSIWWRHRITGDISILTFLNEIVLFLFIFLWNLFPRVTSIISQHWLR